MSEASGAQRDPFPLTIDPTSYVPSQARERALAQLVSALDVGQVPCLQGPTGIGKTLLLRVLGERVAARYTPLYLPYPLLSAREHCAMVLGLLKRSTAADPEAMLETLAAELALNGRPLLLLLDDAASLPVESARGLAALVIRARRRLHVVLAGIGGESLLRAAELFGDSLVRVALEEGIADAALAGYVTAQLERAQAPESIWRIFDDETLAELGRQAGGNPRKLHLAAQAILRRVEETASPLQGPTPRDAETATPDPELTAPLRFESAPRANAEIEPTAQPSPAPRLPLDRGVVPAPVPLAPAPSAASSVFDEIVTAPTELAAPAPLVAAAEPPAAPPIAMSPPVVRSPAPAAPRFPQIPDLPSVTPAPTSPEPPTAPAVVPAPSREVAAPARVAVSPTPVSAEPTGEYRYVRGRAAPPAAATTPAGEQTAATAAGVPTAQGELPVPPWVEVKPTKTARLKERPRGGESPGVERRSHGLPVAGICAVAAVSAMFGYALASHIQSGGEDFGALIERLTTPRSTTVAAPDRAAVPVAPAEPVVPSTPETAAADTANEPSTPNLPSTAPAPSTPPAAAEPRIAAPEPAEPIEPVVSPISVSINATPWARIEIDGEPAGETPLGGVALKPGRHRFRAEFPDGRVRERDVEIDAAHRTIVFE